MTDRDPMATTVFGQVRKYCPTCGEETKMDERANPDEGVWYVCLLCNQDPDPDKYTPYEERKCNRDK